MIDMCEIEQMRERGLSLAQIGNKLGLHPNTVQYYCHEHGIVGPNDFARPSKKYPPEVDAKIIEYREQGVSFEQISRIMDMPPTTVRNRMRTVARHQMLVEAA